MNYPDPVPLTRRSALALLAVGGLTGCAFKPISWGEPTGSPVPTASADNALEVAEDYFNQSPDSGAKMLNEGITTMQRISTPHFDARLDRRFAGETLSAQTVAQVFEQGAIRAPQGFELVAFTLQAGHPYYGETDTARAAVEILVAASTVIPLTAPFGVFNDTTRRFAREWVLVILAVPAGAPVMLQVRDEGLTVAVDLRSGAPVVDEAWAANTGFRERVGIKVIGDDQVFHRTLATLPTGALQKQTSRFSFGIKPQASWGLVPWNSEDGWAEKGKQWLRISTGARVAFEPPGNPAVIMDIDVVNSFQYVEGTAAPIPAHRPKTITTEAIYNGEAVLDVTWLVPGMESRATITCNPVGELRARYSDHPDVSAEFTGAASPISFTLAFSPLEEEW